VEEVVINGDVVTSGAKPLFIYAERRDEAGTSA
jgi:hypothetical protein